MILLQALPSYSAVTPMENQQGLLAKKKHKHFDEDGAEEGEIVGARQVIHLAEVWYLSYPGLGLSGILVQLAACIGALNQARIILPAPH